MTSFRRAHNRKLTDDQVRAIRRLCAEGERSKASIGRLFGVGPMCVLQVASRLNYRDVPDEAPADKADPS